MTSNDDEQCDFRSRAAAVSESIRRTLPSGSLSAKDGISYCLERQPSLAGLRAPIKASIVLCGLLGISGIAGGGIIGLLLKRGVVADEPTLLMFAACCCVGGILLMFVPMFFERWIVRRHLSERDDDLGSDSRVKGFHVSLEDARTYDGSLKLLAEDVGLIYLDSTARYVKFDGLSYQYVAQSKDVVDLSLHSNGKTVLLSYLVGDEQLDLAIEPRSLLAELKRQTIGSSPSLFVKIRDALQTDEHLD